MKKLHSCCRRLPGATEDVKWECNLVFSVGGKMFAVFAKDEPRPTMFSFKATPEEFARLTTAPGFIPAPYLAKQHWVGVVDKKVAALPEIPQLLESSYRLVAAKLSKKLQRELGLL
ncbi:MAG TPA: MmcQ/YjbR family DNA-binding protein [Planctomycetia bacterium]|nr:MmcQ/YjbR family DNA-binding protein [Planctomycetia bacterium]